MRIKDTSKRIVKYFYVVFGLFMFISISNCDLYAQKDTIRVPLNVYPDEGILNELIKNVAASGNLSTTVFKLASNSKYILSDSIFVPAGEHLTIVAPEPGFTQETAPPQILCSQSFDYPSKKTSMIYSNGDVTMKNIWLYYADTTGWQIPTCIQFGDNSVSGNVQTGNFDNVIFDYSKTPKNTGGAVTITAKHFKGNFKNCYWKNCVDAHYRYYGRAVSFPFQYKEETHIDSISFENCTFANIGYVYMQENGHYADYVKFNHCTFLNVVLYVLESGWWNKLSVTNSIFLNSFMFGELPLTAEELFGGIHGGTIRIDSVANFGFNVPFSDGDRRILFANNSYYIENWLSTWMTTNPIVDKLRQSSRLDEIYRPEPMLSPKTLQFFDGKDSKGKKLFPYMNKANLHDSTDPGFLLAPTDVAAIKTFLLYKWYADADTNWAFYPDLSLKRHWPFIENLAYQNPVLLSAGLDNFPLGDLYRWFPHKYEEWKLQEKTENERIAYWQENGRDSIFTDIRNFSDESLQNQIELYQNYPNPFNPSTTIQFKIPVVDAPSPSAAEAGAAEAHVILKIYDMLGREVAALVDEYKQPGNYSVTFDIRRSVENRQLSSGIYFYQLTSGNFISTKKMVLLK